VDNSAWLHTFEGARKISAPANSIILVENEDRTPLVYKTTVNDVSVFVINMEPQQSELYYNVYFPIIIYSLSFDLAGRDVNKSYNLPTGALIKSETNTPIVTPEGAVPDSGDFLKADRVGFYELGVGRDFRRYAVSLTNKFESMINNDAVVTTSKPIESGYPISDLLLIIAIVLVSVECMLYHRRKVG